MIDYHSHPHLLSKTDILSFMSAPSYFNILDHDISFSLFSQFHFFKIFDSKNEISTPKDKLETNAINSETFTFTGVAEDLEGDARTGINKIQYAIKTTDTEPTENELKDIATTGSWKFVNEEKLTEGEYFLFVRAVDNAGNVSEKKSHHQCGCSGRGRLHCGRYPVRS